MLQMNISSNETLESLVTWESPLKPVVFIIPCLMLYLAIWIGVLINKYLFTLEPVHLVSINCLCDYVITIFMDLVIRILEYLEHQDTLCSVAYFLENWSKVMIFQSFSLMELDRFLALFWNMLYYERVTSERTMIFIIIMKCSTLILLIIDALASDVTFCSLHVCPFNEVGFHAIVTSQTVYILTTAAVCIYVFEKARKHQNLVVPVFIVGQQQHEVESPQSNIAKLTKIGLKVNILSLIQLVPEFPRVIVTIFLHVHNYPCDDSMIVVKFLHVTSLISTITVPILIAKKLYHYTFET